MKKMALLAILLTVLLSGNYAFAFGEKLSCNIPEFLKEGKVYEMSTLDGSVYEAPVLRIDKKSCWLQINLKKYTENENDSLWLNLEKIIGIRELDK